MHILSYPCTRVYKWNNKHKFVSLVCEGKKQTQLLSTASMLWFWRWKRLMVHFRDKFLFFLCCGTSWFKNNFCFHHHVTENLFHFSTNIPAFLTVRWLTRDNIIASSDSVSHLISDICHVFQWYFVLDVLLLPHVVLVTLGLFPILIIMWSHLAYSLFSSLCGSKYVTTRPVSTGVARGWSPPRKIFAHPRKMCWVLIV